MHSSRKDWSRPGIERVEGSTLYNSAKDFLRFGAASAAVLAAITLSACGGSGSSESPASSGTSAPAAPTASPANSNSSSNGTGTAQAGEAIFQRDCGGCHHAGSVGKGRIALDHIGSQHDASWLKVQIRTPEQHHSRMPAFGTNRLSDRDLSTLITYLLSQK